MILMLYPGGILRTSSSKIGRLRRCNGGRARSPAAFSCFLVASKLRPGRSVKVAQRSSKEFSAPRVVYLSLLCFSIEVAPCIGNLALAESVASCFHWFILSGRKPFANYEVLRYSEFALPTLTCAGGMMAIG